MRYGASHFSIGWDGERRMAAIMFRAENRMVRMRMLVPENPQEERSAWRCLLLAIKSKLQSVESGLETFEEAFLAHVVLSDGMTVYERTAPSIATEYVSGVAEPRLLGPAQ